MSNKNFYAFIFCSLVLALSCGKDNKVMVIQDDTPFVLEFGNLPTPNLPTDNMMTKQGVELGKMLFYEKMLSKDGTQACAGCHKQADGFSDTTRFSIGVEKMPGFRQAMPIFNMAWNNNEFFWDGRAHLLRDQSLKPIQDPLEMNETLDNVVSKLGASQLYKDQFMRTFGSEEITPKKMSLAMEQFMLSIVSFNSKYDKYLAGEVALTESEERGRKLFETEYNPFFPDDSGADCKHCHGGANLTNDSYINNGLDKDAEIKDLGRGRITMNEKDKARFKVPSLRNIAVTAPYMHDGRFQTLEQVIDHYNEGIQESATVAIELLNTKETGLMLSVEDKKDLVNFLKTFTDETYLNNDDYKTPF